MIVHPELPGPLKLEDPKFSDCGEQVCLSRPEAKKVVNNTIRTGRWASRMTRAVKYYRSLFVKKERN